MHVHRSSSGVHPSSVHHKLHCVCVCVWASTYQWSNVDSCVLLCSPISRALFDYFPAAGEHHAGNLSFYEGDIVEVSIRYHCIHVYGIAVCWICTTVVCVRMCMPALRVSFHHTLLHFNTMLQEAKNLNFFCEEFLWFFFAEWEWTKLNLFVRWTQICMDFDGGPIKIKLRTVWWVIFMNRLRFIFSAIIF